MKRLIAIVFSLVLGFWVTFTAETVHADVLRADDWLNPGITYKFAGQFAWNERPGFAPGDNLTTGESIDMFCINFGIGASSAFFSENGQQFTTQKLANDTVFSSKQKQAIQSLYDYVYPLVLPTMSAGSLNLAGLAFQMAIWEIVHEKPTNDWNLKTGDFRENGLASNYSGASNTLVTSTIDGYLTAWFGNIKTGVWEGYEKESFDVFTSRIGNNSQPMIYGVAHQSNVTPEPATLLVLGAGGLVLLPIMRRMRNRKSF